MAERKEQLQNFPLHLGFLASHNGTDMQGIIAALHSDQLAGDACVVISNNSNSGALSYANENAIPNYCINDKRFESPDPVIRDVLLRHRVNIVILSGYMKKVGPETLATFPKHILNIHPALLPKYKGMWGDAVHKAVLESGDTVTGVTIHIANNEYDEGPILWQSEVDVMKNDTIETLRERVQQKEINAFIQLLNKIQTGELKL